MGYIVLTLAESESSTISSYSNYGVWLSAPILCHCVVPIQVEGDTVTFTFEMKSGREHSTPDKAMWGFACTVRPQESAEDSPTGLSFVTDLYLSLVSVCCSLIGCLYSGPEPTPEEEKCRPLMDSELLQRLGNTMCVGD